MGLKVIGAGFGRTGTLSLKRALEILGYAPCFHGMELLKHPEYLPQWQAAANGEVVDWDKVFVDYIATVDWPAAFFWRELAAFYPEAKVILSTRDSERWYKSIYRTIFQAHALAPTHVRSQRHWLMVEELVFIKTFGGRLDDRAHAIEVYERHNEEVQRTIAADRLLVFEVSAGCEPLCRHLGLPIPQVPFPSGNTTEDFQGVVPWLKDKGSQ